MSLFIHLFNKYLLSILYISDTVLHEAPLKGQKRRWEGLPGDHWPEEQKTKYSVISMKKKMMSEFQGTSSQRHV